MSAHDETVIAELRRCRAGLKVPTPAERPAWTMKLTMEEVDALLRAVDERDDLRREVCGDPTPPFPPVSVTVAHEGVYETRRCDSICDGDGGRSSCFTPWCRCTVCHGPIA